VRRSAYPARYFATVADASAWIAVETGRRSTELADASFQLREQLNGLNGARSHRPSGPVSRWPGRGR
jgi:hypothetical protein